MGLTVTMTSIAEGEQGSEWKAESSLLSNLSTNLLICKFDRTSMFLLLNYDESPPSVAPRFCQCKVCRGYSCDSRFDNIPLAGSPKVKLVCPCITFLASTLKDGLGPPDESAGTVSIWLAV